MSTSRDCFDYVFGLSRTDCNCFGSAPSDFDVSNSGLYLDEVPGLNLKSIFAAADCENTGWEIMTKARDEAVPSFRSKILARIKSDTRWMREPIRGTVAERKETKTLRLTHTYHGIKLLFANHVGGTATIKRIGGQFKFNGSVNISIYRNDTDAVETATITATMNKAVWTEITPIEIDLGTKSASNAIVWLVFQPTSGQEVLKNTIGWCGCDGKPKWDASTRHFESAVAMNGAAWTQWMQAQGTYGTSLSDMEDWSTSNDAQGLMVDVEFKCDARTVVCTGEPEYQGDPIQQSFAIGSRAEAALNILGYITGSTNVNREAIINGDKNELLKVDLMKKVDEHVSYISDMLTEDADGGRYGVNTYSDCFTCKHGNSPVVSTIRR